VNTIFWKNVLFFTLPPAEGNFSHFCCVFPIGLGRIYPLPLVQLSGIILLSTCLCNQATSCPYLNPEETLVAIYNKTVVWQL